MKLHLGQFLSYIDTHFARNRPKPSASPHQHPWSALAQEDHLRWYCCCPVVDLTIPDTIPVNSSKWVGHAHTILEGNVLVTRGMKVVTIGIPDGCLGQSYVKGLHITRLDGDFLNRTCGDGCRVRCS